jgi:ATP-dependent Clp protease ATP-binding subunit ClpA
MLERFSERAIKVMINAQSEATRLHHSHIGREHVLVALLSDSSSRTAKVLHSAGLKLSDVRKEHERLCPPGETESAPEFDADTRQLINDAWREAKQLKSNAINTGHLLLAICRGSRNAVDVRIIQNLGGDPNAIYQTMLKDISSPPDPTPQVEAATDIHGLMGYLEMTKQFIERTPNHLENIKQKVASGSLDTQTLAELDVHLAELKAALEGAAVDILNGVREIRKSLTETK